MSLTPRGKILPPFVNSVEDLDKMDDDTGRTYRDLWKCVPVKHFDKVLSKPIDYPITDEMILAYSKQFETLRDMIQQHVSQMKTWRQLAVEYGLTRNPKLMRPSLDKSYFISEWLVTPVRHGPSEGSCGCGCGCGCG